MNASTGEIKEQTVFMGDFPIMTDKGTFIINGTERVVVSQLVRSPGVIFQPGRDAKTIVTGTIHPYRGEWIEFDVEAGSPNAGRHRWLPASPASAAFSLFVVLRAALGYGEDEGFLQPLRPPLRLPSRGRWEEGARPRPPPVRRRCSRSTKPRPSRRAAVARGRPCVLRGNAFFNPTPLRPHRESVATSSTASSDRRSRRSARDPRDRPRAARRRGPGRCCRPVRRC